MIWKTFNRHRYAAEHGASPWRTKFALLPRRLSTTADGYSTWIWLRFFEERIENVTLLEFDLHRRLSDGTEGTITVCEYAD